MLASLPLFIVLVHCCSFLLERRPARIIASSEVIFTFLGAWLRLDEGSNLIQIIGTAIVLVGIILTQTARANKVIDAGLAFRA
jgi:drug/metabolite transporter (DMT)-like permease